MGKGSVQGLGGNDIREATVKNIYTNDLDAYTRKEFVLDQDKLYILTIEQNSRDQSPYYLKTVYVVKDRLISIGQSGAGGPTEIVSLNGNVLALYNNWQGAYGVSLVSIYF